MILKDGNTLKSLSLPEVKSIVSIIPTVIIVTIVGFALQLSGVWITMILAGMFGALFTRSHLKSFIAGFFGVAAAWGILYLYLSITAQAVEVAEFFIGLLGLTGMGWLVFVISMLFGGLLGGFGGGLGRSFYELIDQYMATSPPPEIREPTGE